VHDFSDAKLEASENNQDFGSLFHLNQRYRCAKIFVHAILAYCPPAFAHFLYDVENLPWWGATDVWCGVDAIPKRLLSGQTTMIPTLRASVTPTWGGHASIYRSFEHHG
jgi:hypothetical protein